VTTTSQIRAWWDPPCSQIGPVLVPAYRALDACLVGHDYPLRQADTGAYNCRRITGGTGYSLHAFGPGHKFTFTGGVTVTTALAVDLNWQTNPYGPTLITDMPKEMVKAITSIRTVDGVQVWRWGGDYAGNKDAMHFEVVCSPAQLGRGLDLATVPNPSEEIDDMFTDADRALAQREADRATGRNAQVQAMLNEILVILSDTEEGTVGRRSKEITLAVRELLTRSAG
jgi:hypothetical protein